MSEVYKLVTTNNNDDYKFVVGIVYNIDSIKIGTFTLELTNFPNIERGLPGSQFITKYEYQINFDNTNTNIGKVNLSGFYVIGTFKLNSGTFFNLSPLGLPYGKYENIGTSICKNCCVGRLDIPIEMNINKNDIDGYECILTIS